MVKIEFFPEPEISFKSHSKYPLCLSEDPFLELILKHKQDFTKLTVHEPVSLEELISENIELKPVNFPKREVLGEEFTDEDYEKLCNKLSQQNEQVAVFKKHQIRDITDKVNRLKSTFIRLTLEEIFTALKTFDYNEEEVSLCLTKTEFITQVRNQIAQSGKDYKKNPIKVMSVSVPNDDVSESENDSDDEELSEESNDEDDGRSKKRKQQQKSNEKKSARLKLDDAVASVNVSGIMEGWSEARIRAYQGMNKNPNAYYYRFNAPGETQRNGPWSREEEELFMKRLKEVGADGQWGIFSIAIPGRVGYQCSNYYRKLIECGKVKDYNYKLDEKGKAHFIGGKTRASTKANDNESQSENESEESEPEIINSRNTSTLQHSQSTAQALQHENPLPGFIDAITQTQVVRPAISPYGHVLSYDTWMKCLLNGDRKNTCPLTNQPLHKRQLIFLTFENIEMYRDAIRKIN